MTFSRKEGKIMRKRFLAGVVVVLTITASGWTAGLK